MTLTSELLDLGIFLKRQAEAFCWCCEAVRACFMDGDVVQFVRTRLILLIRLLLEADGLHSVA